MYTLMKKYNFGIFGKFKVRGGGSFIIAEIAHSPEKQYTLAPHVFTLYSKFILKIIFRICIHKGWGIPQYTKDKK